MGREGSYSLSSPHSRDSSGPEKISQRVCWLRSAIFCGIERQSSLFARRIFFSKLRPSFVCPGAGAFAAAGFAASRPVPLALPATLAVCFVLGAFAGWT